MNLLLIAAFALLFILLSFTARRQVPGRTISLFRALFPSWRFFEDVGEIPRLLYRLRPDGEEFGPWTECLPPHRRSFRSVILNAEGNLLFACHSLVDQLLTDMSQDEAGITRSVSYQLVTELVRQRALRSGAASSGTFQFRITELPERDAGYEDDLLLSLEHELR